MCFNNNNNDDDDDDDDDDYYYYYYYYYYQWLKGNTRHNTNIKLIIFKQNNFNGLNSFLMKITS